MRASELADSLQLTFNGAVAISIPSLTLPLVDFLAQGTPIPAIEGTSAAINLEPYKMAVITSLSGEILRQQRSDRASSVARQRWPGARCGDVFRLAVTEERPPGLLNGIAALTPTAAVAGIKAEGMIDVEGPGRWETLGVIPVSPLEGRKGTPGQSYAPGVLSSQVRLLCGAAGVSSGG